MNPRMLTHVLLPLVGMNNFSLIAIATPADAFNHYSQLMDRTDDEGRPLFKTVRIALSCPACLAKVCVCVCGGRGAFTGRGTQGIVHEACPHRQHLLPFWKSSGRLSRIAKVLAGDPNLNARENLGVITSDTTYFIDSQWVLALNRRPPYVFEASVPLVFIGVDPAGGGTRSNYAIVSVVLHRGQCVVRLSLSFCLRGFSVSRNPGTSRWWPPPA